MDTHKLKDLRKTDDVEAWFWAWFCLSAIVVAIAAGNIVGDDGFHVGAALGGLVAGVIGNLPAWVVFDMLRRILLSKHEIHLITTRPEREAEK